MTASNEALLQEKYGQLFDSGSSDYLNEKPDIPEVSPR